MKPEEQWTPVDYWKDLSMCDLEPETYVRVGNELAEYATQLEAQLAAHKENEGEECPLCKLEAENKQLKGVILHAYMKLHGHALKDVGPILSAALSKKPRPCTVVRDSGSHNEPC